jgi:hypothetical protein
MLIRSAAPGELKYNDVYDAIQRGVIQRDRLLKLDTPLGQDILIPLRAQGWAKIFSAGRKRVHRCLGKRTGPARTHSDAGLQ